MWVLLNADDIIQAGDEFWREKAGMWEPMSPHTWDFGGRVKEEHPPMRRKLTGWAAVTQALKAEVLGNNKEGCETIPWMWECECDKDFLHVGEESGVCKKCGVHDSDAPDARKAEVILSIIEEE